MTSYTFEQIKKFLKLSKSELVDNGPYTTTYKCNTDYHDIWDADNRIVGQASGLELRVNLGCPRGRN